MLRRFAALSALAAACVLGAPAHAQLSELRGGVAAHDVYNGREDGVQIIAEVLFDSPDFLNWAYSPRPYIMGSFNTSGLTNLGAVGLAWEGSATERLTFEGSWGIAYHDGVTDYVDLPPDDPDRIRLAATRAGLGSHYLFHLRLGTDYALNDTWRVGVFYEHYSHGQILGNGRNQALDEIGVRLGYRFGN
ncbi:acyloxyacyl hydrolase [Hyphomonadaceae bacterium ML37]|nr:acyloxyacyl hydrolase [Hyphomonadaceae bacterium ML37]